MKIIKELVDQIKFIVFLLIIFSVIKAFFAQPYIIPSGSMKPGLLVGDFIFVTKYQFGYSASSFPKPLALWLGRGRILEQVKPTRGEVIVFRNEKDGHKEYIKRLIGLPGDKIQMMSGVLYVNDIVVTKELTKMQNGLCSGTDKELPQYKESIDGELFYSVIECDENEGWTDQTGQYIVPEGHYFMMGDNRDQSQDSRYINEVGYIPHDRVVGTAKLILFSFNTDVKIWEFWKWNKLFRANRTWKKIK